jgi:hypothetical protein
MIPFYLSLLSAIGTVTIVILLGYTISWFIANVFFGDF